MRDGVTAGKLTLTTIFRDHSRAEIAATAAIRPADQVLVPASAYFRAILDQIDAATARGDFESARRFAEQASIPGAVQDAATAQDLNNAGIIAELHGDTQRAIQFYRRALQSGPDPQDRDAIEKNLARVEAKPQ